MYDGLVKCPSNAYFLQKVFPSPSINVNVSGITYSYVFSASVSNFYLFMCLSSDASSGSRLDGLYHLGSKLASGGGGYNRNILL